MDDLQEEVSISEKESDFVWVYFLKLNCYFLNILVVQRNFCTSKLENLCINLLLKELLPEALS
jgi:hypothetical protein